MGNRGVSAPEISNDQGDKKVGLDSLKIHVGSGVYAEAEIRHDFLAPQDWSQGDNLCFYLKQQNTDSEISILVRAPDLENSWISRIKDDQKDWSEFRIRLSEFHVNSVSILGSVTSHLHYMAHSRNMASGLPFIGCRRVERHRDQC